MAQWEIDKGTENNPMRVDEFRLTDKFSGAGVLDPPLTSEIDNGFCFGTALRLFCGDLAPTKAHDADRMQGPWVFLR